MHVMRARAYARVLIKSILIMKYKVALCLIALFMIGGAVKTQAQNIAIKTNLLYDVTATANVGVEVGLAPKWTLDL